MKRVHPHARARRRGVHLLLVLTALLLASGLAWLVLDTAFAVEGEFGPAKHPLQAWMLRAHGAFAMAMLVAFGSLLPNHALPLWNARRNRGAGVVLLALVLGLALTGYLLYYLGDETRRVLTARIHWIGGAALALAFPLHMALGKRATAQRKQTLARGRRVMKWYR